MTKRTEQYTSLDAVTIEIFVCTDHLRASDVEVSMRDGTNRKVLIKIDNNHNHNNNRDDSCSETKSTSEGDVFEFDLSEACVLESSKVKVSSKKIEVKLMKMKKKNVVANEDEDKVAIENRTIDVLSTISTSSNNKRNDSYVDKWSKIEFMGDMEDELDTLGGDAALNKMFQDLYKDADDDQRRAMMKSFVESNGTVLSTDWTDVGEKFVDPQEPDGMKLKTFEM
jgi:sugar diacid utilization regulator